MDEIRWSDEISWTDEMNRTKLKRTNEMDDRTKSDVNKTNGT